MGEDSGKPVPKGKQLAPEDRNHVIAPDDVIAPPGVEGKIQANIKAIRDIVAKNKKKPAK